MSKTSWRRKYFEESTVHCLQYLVQKNRSLIEKLFWIFTIISTYFIANWIVFLLIGLWLQSPSVIYVDNTESSIKEIPFPTITICSSNQIRKQLWTASQRNDSSFMKNIKQYEQLLCFYLSDPIPKPYDNLEQDIVRDMMSVCPVRCSEMLKTSTVWLNATLPNICDFAQQVPSLLGVCYSLNMLPAYQMFNDDHYNLYKDFFFKNVTYKSKNTSIEWNTDDGYPPDYNDDINDDLPVRTIGVGYYHRLRMMVHSYPHDFLNCPLMNYNFFLVLFSNPAEYPIINTRAFFRFGTYTKVQIIPSVKKIHPNLRWRSPEVRNCYLNNERKLSVFKHYTESNCLVECLMNETISLCGCGNLYLVPLPKDIPVCGPSKVKCMDRARERIRSLGLSKSCNCLPACTKIDYDVELSTYDENTEYFKITNLENNNSSIATVDIAFKDLHFTAITTTSIFSWLSLVSNIGGILSLFLGFSLINVFELVFVFIQILFQSIKSYFTY
ncbi:pickpocket protein 28-like [Adelges cooleyi]|uniref:pickpocket protein 28-like n=1 Tax=Adelges cooleyi TaxID=133065 RepID=UPI00217FFAE8|nr:pickpocket protein 28-like [Adelges cooleyi]